MYRKRRSNIIKQHFLFNYYLQYGMCDWELFTCRNKYSFYIFCISIFWLLKYFGLIFIQLIFGIVILIFQLSINNMLIFILFTCVFSRIKYSLRNIKYKVYSQHFRNGIFLISNILNGYSQHLFRS